MTPPTYPSITFSQPMDTSSFQNEPANTVCDTCRARKVKCDRNDPCGNCVDGSITCTRMRSTRRRIQKISKRQRSAERSPSTSKNIRRHELEISPTSTSYSPSVAQSPSLMVAQDFIQRELRFSGHMEADRLAVLTSAMSFVDHLSQTETPSAQLGTQRSRVIDTMEGITYPSAELLGWMIREIQKGSMGPYVLDYFKHVSLKSVKMMGFALINRNGDDETLLLSSVCVNSVAFKFINTMLSTGQLQGMEDNLRASAGRHLESVRLAMDRMQLLAAPSLLLLQSLLCGAFITQGIGDTTSCWTFISAACKICEDLGLEARINAYENEFDEDAQEAYYCFVWCHVLDKNYSMMLGRSRCLLDLHGLDTVFSPNLGRSMSSLLSTYLLFVPIQAIFIAELHPTTIANNQSLLPRVEFVITDLLRRMGAILLRINELRGSLNSWDGLYMESELNTIEFSYHSLRTSILRAKQICTTEKPYVDGDCLESARMAMSALRAIQVEASVSISDVRAHVSFMHWTVLYHPLTPFFALFCHVVATSNEQDYRTLKLVSSGLNELTSLSSSIAKLQNLFASFIDLCDSIMTEPDTSMEKMGSGFNTEGPTNNRNIASENTLDTNPDFPVNDLIGYHSTSDVSLQLPTGENPDHTWTLFDAQPTLDWLDADFSFVEDDH